MQEAKDVAKPHYHGHRARVRERFLEQGLEGFRDYEALELLLFYVVPRKDRKPLAKDLVDRFGSFKEVLDAPADELQEVKGIGPAAAALIHFIKEAAVRYLQQTSQARFSPETPEALVQYCIVPMGAEPNEKFRVICLDSNFAILEEQDVAEGTCGSGNRVSAQGDGDGPGGQGHDAGLCPQPSRWECRPFRIRQDGYSRPSAGGQDDERRGL
jgi:DNA repair protein RadC